MSTFKRIDAWTSTILIVFFGLLSLALRGYLFIWGYFVVGSWQVISMLVHAANHWFTDKKGIRYIYHCTTAVIIGMGLLTFVIHFFGIIFFILLFAAPFMAIFYTALCFEELKKAKTRPLELFK